MINKIVKNIILIILIGGLAAAGLSFIYSANAVGREVPVREKILRELNKLIEQHTKDIFDLLTEIREDQIATQKLKQELTAKAQAEVIKSITGERSGGLPQYVTNYGAFVNNINAQVTQGFGNVVQNTPYCAPFADSIRNVFGVGGPSLGFSFDNNFTVPFQQKSGCTLGNLIGGNSRANFEAVYNDLASVPNGPEVLAAAWSPQNNFIGASLNASTELQNQIDTEVRNFRWETEDGQGFLAQKDCSGGNDCVIVTPARTNQQLLSDSLKSTFEDIANADTSFEIQLDRLVPVVTKTIDDGLNTISGIFDQLNLGGILDTIIKIGQSAFNSLKNSALTKVNDALGFRNSIDGTLSSGISFLNSYKTTLSSYQNQINQKLRFHQNATTCRRTTSSHGGGNFFTNYSQLNIPNLKNTVAQELNKTNSKITELTNLSNVNSSALTDLQSGKNQIQGYTNTPTDRLDVTSTGRSLEARTDIGNLVVQDDQLKINNDDMQAQVNATKSNLNTLMSQLNQCNSFH